VATAFLVPWILTRGNARGQSRAFAWATVLGPGGLGLGLFPALSPSAFNNWHFYALVVSLMSLSVTYLLLLERHLRSPAMAPHAPGPRQGAAASSDS
jgi:hypothetical protein